MLVTLQVTSSTEISFLYCSFICPTAYLPLTVKYPFSTITVSLAIFSTLIKENSGLPVTYPKTSGVILESLLSASDMKRSYLGSIFEEYLYFHLFLSPAVLPYFFFHHVQPELLQKPPFFFLLPIFFAFLQSLNIATRVILLKHKSIRNISLLKTFQWLLIFFRAIGKSLQPLRPSKIWPLFTSLTSSPDTLPSFTHLQPHLPPTCLQHTQSMPCLQASALAVFSA